MTRGCLAGLNDTKSRRDFIVEKRRGRTLANRSSLENLGRYDVHLELKLERLLAMLVRLRELQQSTLAR
jgi:hypothetical protein